MSENKEEICMKAFKDLSEFTFVIPSQQRGYKWTPKNVEELLKDLWEFTKQKTKNIYCLQPIAVVKNGECEYEVLDGQQRLTTLFLLYKYLTQKNAYTLNFERDSNECDKSRWKFLNDIDKEEKLDNSHQIDRFYIKEAYKKIKNFFESFEKNQPSVFADSENKDIKQIFRSLLDASRCQKSVQVIWYETPKEKAHETFRNLNSGKISLTNTDLIKALLLNRVNGLPANQHETVARQFEEMEQTLKLDHFWHMLSSEVPKYPHTRMDLLFNVVANVEEKEVQIDYRTSFRRFAEESLEQKWQQVRHTFLRLYDMYMDMYSYHYIGFLTYYKTGDSIKRLHELISDNEKMDKNEFIEKLRGDIKKAINPNDQKQIEDYSYTDSSRKELRELFLLHNIETLLQRYQTLKNSEQYKLQHEYEQFPFELLYKQSWDIEHIASQTTNELKNEKDREDWLKSVKVDYLSYFNNNNNAFEKTKDKKDFDKLYEEIINYIKKENQDYIEEDNKNNIGNLVLLDKHTNRSFHNSLFPRKRRIVIMADGLASENDEEQNVVRQFIPICTKQCFTKAYNKSSDVKLGEWLQDDANEYLKDIKEKLNKYFTNEKQ
ncbi:conserved hypothetical protein [Bacteroidetes oral taxon 274 str. F0058]|nr:conserved hypothetical protein [Bacteroidetes oral taxon 274 str. F0058]